MRFAIPLCVSFFCGMIPYMVLWDEVGFCRKTIFPAHFFLAHAWTASNPHKINMWVDLGTWNIVFFNNLKKTEALQKINLSSSEKMFFSRMLGNQALENHFFACLLSNLPTPPCYLTFACSKLCRCLQYKTKNALRIWGTLSLLWCKFACI